jgi:hypothetical protein
MTTIKLKNGSGAPLAGDLVAGEPALDLTNKRLYTEDSGGTVIEVGTNPGEDVTFADNRKAIFGAGSDLEIFHDGSSTSFIQSSTSNIEVKVNGGGNFKVGDEFGNHLFIVNDNGDVQLKHGSTPALKLATTATGIDVTGTVTADAVGIGTSSPNALLSLSSGSGTKTTIETTRNFTVNRNFQIAVDEYAEGTLTITPSTTLGGSTYTTPIITATAAGNTGLGTSSPGGKLSIRATSFAGSDSHFGFGANNDIYLTYGSTGNTIFRTVSGSGVNSEKMRIDASGNLLVSKTSDDNSTAGVVLRDTGEGSFVASGQRSGLFNRLSSDGEIINFRKDGTTVGSIGAKDGNLFIGTGDTGVRFSSGTDSIFPIDTSTGNGRDASIDLGLGAGGRFKDLYLSGASYASDVRSTGIQYFTHTTDARFRNSSGTERMRINSNGSLEISGNGANNEISPFLLNVGNPANDSYRPMSCHVASTAARSQILFYNPAGLVGYISTSGTSTSYLTSSDYRLKENVVPLTGATERVKQLNPSRFNFIADADTTVDGFIAHEVADVVPEAITGTKDGMRDEEYEVTPAVYEDVVIPAVLDEEGNEVEAERTEQQLVSEAVMGTRSVPDYQGIDQSKLVPLLVATIQELEARITALESN